MVSAQITRPLRCLIFPRNRISFRFFIHYTYSSFTKEVLHKDWNKYTFFAVLSYHQYKLFREVRMRYQQGKNEHFVPFDYGIRWYVVLIFHSFILQKRMELTHKLMHCRAFRHFVVRTSAWFCSILSIIEINKHLFKQLTIRITKL